MKKLITLLLVIFGITNIYGQTTLPPAYEIISDTTTSYISLPDSNWQMMADPSGKLTLQEVMHSNLFQYSSRKIDYHIHTYWVRYRLKNKMTKEVQITLWLRRIQYADIYARTDGMDWQHFRTGELIPWSQRDGLKSLIALNLTIPAGKSLVIFGKHTFDYKLSQPDIETAGFSFSKRVAQQQ